MDAMSIDEVILWRDLAIARWNEAHKQKDG